MAALNDGILMIEGVGLNGIKPSVRRSTAETRRRLMLVAEELAATRGLGGLSARDIAKKARLRNNVSVQYHFGSVEVMLRSLVQLRMKQLDEIRAEMLESGARRALHLSVGALVRMLCWPHVILARREGGRATYAAFLCQYLPTEYPAGFDWVMHSPDPELPALNCILGALHERLPDFPAEIFHRRVTNASLLFLNVIQGLPPKAFLDPERLEGDAIVQDALRQSTAVILAPTAR